MGRQAERGAGRRPGLTSDERARLKQLERENFELKRSNEILRKALACRPSSDQSLLENGAD
jgi:transposase